MIVVKSKTRVFDIIRTPEGAELSKLQANGKYDLIVTDSPIDKAKTKMRNFCEFNKIELSNLITGGYPNIFIDIITSEYVRIGGSPEDIIITNNNGIMTIEVGQIEL